MKQPLVALAGGVGAARFLSGFPPDDLFVVVNTADDTQLHGLHISPDLDTVTYTLAGLSDPGQGWGLRDDTFHCLEELGRRNMQTQKVGRIGHGVGLESTEYPSLALGESIVLEPGMIFACNPNYVTSFGFFNSEENLVITPTGNGILSKPEARDEVFVI